jgi:acylphosphatase
MKIAARIVARGLVQGVAYRHFTRQRALEEGVCGWVRNLPDDSVEGWFEGDGERVQALIDWCRRGPPSARVEKLEVEQHPYSGLHDDFSIRH